MPGIPPGLVPALKELYALRSLSEDELAKITAASELVELAKDQRLTINEAEQAPFYMVISGRVTLEEYRGSGGVFQDPLQYKSGSFFGADSLLYGRIRNLTAKAATPVQLLFLPVAMLRRLLLEMPGFKEGLLFAGQMQHWLGDKSFRWIGDDEIAYLITRKHQVFLFIRLVMPVLLLSGSLFMIYISSSIPISSFQMATLWTGMLLSATAILWLIWRYIDWGNDYYVVTDQRVVWVEQVLWMYESRREAFLSSIRNKQTQTENWLERRFGYGDIIMTVYAGQLVFKNIPDPQEVSQLIDLLVRRSSMRVKKQDVQETQNLIMQKIKDVEKIMREEIDPIPPPSLPKSKPKRSFMPNWKDILAFFRAETRFEQGEMITYRTHYVFLAMKLFLPVLAQVGVIIVAGLNTWNGLNGQPVFPSVPTTILTALSLLVLLFAWATYHYMDWRNDIYQILPDKLVDRDQRPFQEEHIVQAFLENIQSLEIQRENLLEMVLNFGTLIINSGTDQKLTFDNIPDPARALQEIYNRLYKLQQNRRKDELLKQAEQSAIVLATYHLFEQNRRPQSSNPQQSQKE